MMSSIKQFYMDTNVFISRLKHDDPYYLEAKAIAKGLEQDELRAETSVLALLEVASVSGRLYETKRGPRGREKEREVFIVRILRRLAGLITKFINIAGDTPVSIRRINTSLPSVFNEAILLSVQSSLKTLDLIHLAAAKHAKQKNNDLGVFVTGDKEFLSKKEELSEIIGMPLLSPREYVEVLGL